MSGSKHFDKIAISVTVITLIILIVFMNGASLGIQASNRNMGYENRLFDSSKVHTIDIVMDDWDDFISNATSEEYYVATLVIDGESFKNVAIRGKGNTSLSTVASLGSERYSFKVEFDHYDSSITYHGLDKLSLNNLIQDSTMMKDYLTYTLMNEFGVASSLCSFVYISVNGEDWGLYLAVEGVEESFMMRNYGSDYGELYKPDNMSFGGGRGNGKDFDMDDFSQKFSDSDNDSVELFTNGFSENTEIPSDNLGQLPFGDMQIPEDNFTNDLNTQLPKDVSDGFGNMKLPENLGENFGDMQLPDNMTFPEGDENKIFDKENGMSAGSGGGMSMGSDDVKLKYIDDDFDSYSNIWDNAKTDITDSDKTRLIESLKKLSSNEDIESVVDVDAVIKYFVVHNFVCNGDSYTGSMVHNYYLYEKDGQLSMIPWDYNLAFGTFSAGNANGAVNTPIDTPVSGGMSDRPMINWIFQSEEYTELYHEYFAKFLESVDIDSVIYSAYELIAAYVEKDPTKFYTYEEFEVGVSTLKEFCSLRKKSIEMQLAEGNTTQTANYVDASGINLSDMGSMNNGNPSEMGGNGFGRNNDSSDGDMSFNMEDNMTDTPEAVMQDQPNSDFQDFTLPDDRMDMFQQDGMQLPEDNNMQQGSKQFPDGGNMSDVQGDKDMFRDEMPNDNITDFGNENFGNAPTIDSFADNKQMQNFGNGENDDLSQNKPLDNDRTQELGNKYKFTQDGASLHGIETDASASNYNSTLILICLSVVVLVLGIVFVKKYK